ERVRGVAASLPPLPPAGIPIFAVAALSVAAAIAIAVPVTWSLVRHPRPAPRTAQAPVVAQSRPPAAGMERGLLGHWTFDEGPAAGPVRDHSGHGRNCTLRDREHAAECVAGRHGGALDLAGKAWLECPQPEVLTAQPSAITVAVWVKLHHFPELHAALATR